jgi:eukaryotic-like serine/threonine-protein kinase
LLGKKSDEGARTEVFHLSRYPLERVSLDASVSRMRSPIIKPGEVLDGKWSIGALLGEGGMGAVFDATHTRNGLTVAVKVLLPEHARDEGVMKRFLQEGYAANRVNHPGTVRVLDDGVTASGIAYLVMEKLDGQTLDERAESCGGTLPVEEVLDLVDKTLQVVAAAHDKGIVHRDLKPENIFLMRDGSVKILDFGIAHVRELTSQARLTVTGIPMGTPAFMPPEQALAKWDQVDARSDVFALGASTWTLLTGRLVHEGTTVPETLVLVSTRQAAPIRSVVPSLSPPVAEVFDRALRFDRNQRWPNAGMMIRALREARALGQQASQSSLNSTIRIDDVNAMLAAPARSPSIPDSGPTLLSGQTPTPRSMLPQIEVVAATPMRPKLRTEAPVSSSSRKTQGDSSRGSRRGPPVMAIGIFVGVLLAAASAFIIVWKKDNPRDIGSTSPADARPNPANTDVPTPELMPSAVVQTPNPTIGLEPSTSAAPPKTANVGSKPASSAKTGSKKGSPSATPTATSSAFMNFE